jgi:hypothetical protein
MAKDDYVQSVVFLYDEAGNAVEVIDDAGTKRLATDSKITSSVLPTGAATEATQVTLLTEADFDARIGEVQATPTVNTVLGRLKALMDDFTSLLSRIPAALIGGRFDTNLGSWLGSTAPTVGQKDMVDSVPVTMASNQTAIEVTIVPPSGDGLVSEPLTDDGTPSGSPDMVVNGAGTPETFTVNADATDNIKLTSIRLVIAAQAFEFDGNSFSKGGGALPNGIEVKITADNGNFIETLMTLTVNEDLYRLLAVNSAIQAGSSVIAASLDFGGNLLLVGGSGDKVEVVINDNLTSGVRGVNYFTCTAYGVLDL